MLKKNVRGRSIDFFPSSPFRWERLSMNFVNPFLKNIFMLLPDASSEGLCWPGAIFRRTVYGRATSQR